MKNYSLEEKIENAIKWIDGLKTTQVKQGTSELGNSERGYCCLGYGCMKLKIPYKADDGTNKEFIKAIGLNGLEGTRIDNNPLGIKNNSNIDSLIEANDDFNYSFRRISTLIKKNIDGLFIPEVAINLKTHYGL